MATPPKAQELKLPFIENLKQQKWLTLIGLPILLITTINGIHSVWGIMFIYWGVTAVMARQVYLLEPIDRQEDPALFWIIAMMWIGFGAMYVLADFYPDLWL